MRRLSPPASALILAIPGAGALAGDRSQPDLLIPDERNEGDSFSQELRLDSAIGDDIDYQLGLFYYEQTTRRGDKTPTVFLGDDFITIGDQQGLPLPVPTLALIAQSGDYLVYQNTWDNETMAEFSGNLGATLVFPLADGGLYIRGDYLFMDDHITSGSRADQLEDKDVDDRELLNAKIGWRNDNWNLSVWGKNLTDDEYAVQTVVTQLFSGQDSYFLAPPRTYGATLRYDY